MTTIAQSLMSRAPIGVPVELPRYGSALEIPHVYDATAREIKAQAGGSVEVTRERCIRIGDDDLIVDLEFVRRR